MAEARIYADLGPTNTGKTHHAILRALRYRSGVIGLPLRLLAREVYTKFCAALGPKEVTLLTGEEQIIGEKSRFIVATAEAMPQDFAAEISILDEVQLAADAERGHIFTDRLLHARGSRETLILGSDIAARAINTLIPDCEMGTRPRLSSLSWVGRRKLANLPPRSAIIAFSAQDVYAIAEYMRRNRGGAAIVMGMLSPRTRNAQVELFQRGDVDFIIATDAIGMGLNLDIDYVFFARTEKFDGENMRPLLAHELAQIAGRAGRFSKDGGFGVTAEARDFSPATIEAIETHRFGDIGQVYWRSSRLDFSSLNALTRSLEAPPPHPLLRKAREADDLYVLRALKERPFIRERAAGSAAVKLLWSVCQLPDFPKFAAGQHVEFCNNLFLELTGPRGYLREDMIEEAVRAIARPHHHIEILAQKLAQIRTWAYIAGRKNWLEHPLAWRERTALIEDDLSMALHEALVESFVDIRSGKLNRRLKEKGRLMAEVNAKGEVAIDGEFVGRLRGFCFEVDRQAGAEDAKTIAQAARAALGPVYQLRTDRLVAAADHEITLDQTGKIIWEGDAIGSLAKGGAVLAPDIAPVIDEDVDKGHLERIRKRLGEWLSRKIEEAFAPLFAIQSDAELTGICRGIGYQLTDMLGIIPRAKIARDLKELPQENRALLRRHGVRFGQYHVFIPALLKPAPTALRLRLHAIYEEEEANITPPEAGLVTIPGQAGWEGHHYRLAGYYRAGERAIRIDMLERLAGLLREAKEENEGNEGGFEASADMLSITGQTLEGLKDLLENLGYSATHHEREARIQAKRALPEGEDARSAAEEGEAPGPGAKVDEASAGSPGAAEGEEAAKEVYYIFRAKPRARGQKRKPQGQKGASTRARNEQSRNSHQERGQSSQARGKTSAQKKQPKPIDPDNPFAALAALKPK